MRALAECPSDVAHFGAIGWRGSLREPKGGVRLQVSSDRPFALHLLDANELITTGPRCDGVLLTETGRSGLACFLELKGVIDPDKPDQPFDQIRGGIEHFAPVPNTPTHGEDHHAAWRLTRDLPVAPRGRGRPKPIAMANEHDVVGAVIVMRAGTRHLPRWINVAGRDVFVAVIQKHGKWGQVTLTLDEIEASVGQPP